ncbi:hypothetical protein [Streptomyces sulphureus]|uniref:hypothetical protein n=1 Tax=Streptomyces sulphureus TaxID=47758 RepID=UPI000371E2F2|nr:hypothetical protein [Streptomyces sulphureus]
MTWNSRLDVAEALERAGWTGDDDRPLEILRHPSGAVWAVANDAGDCGVDTPGGGVADFPGDVADSVVIAAALAASGQLAVGQTDPVDEYRYCGSTLDRTEFPYTCYRRVAHDGGCGPEEDCRHESWDVTGEHRTDAGWVKSRRCNDCSESLPSVTEPQPHWDLRPAADARVETGESPEDAADVTAWAARLEADRLQPDAHTLTWAAGPQPIVRVHFAFHEGLDDEARAYLVQAVGEALGREMTAAATP